MENPSNHHVFSINTVCNYDRDSINYIYSNVGSAYIRISKTEFELDNNKKIYITKQNF